MPAVAVLVSPGLGATICLPWLGNPFRPELELMEIVKASQVFWYIQLLFFPVPFDEVMGSETLMSVLLGLI